MSNSVIRTLTVPTSPQFVSNSYPDCAALALYQVPTTAAAAERAAKELTALKSSAEETAKDRDAHEASGLGFMLGYASGSGLGCFMIIRSLD